MITRKKLSALLMCWPLLSWAEHVDVYIPPDVLADYQTFLNGRSVSEISYYGGDGARRDVVEVVLFQQALAQTSDRWQINFIEQPDYSDMLDGLEEGKAIASVTSLWRKDLTTRWDSLYMTTAVIERGQFEAGFYTPADNTAVLSSRTDPVLKQLRGVSSQNWVIDWKTLQTFGANVTHADTWGAMVQQVFIGDQDYLLAPFQPTPDLRLELDDGILVPIPGVKIALLGTRHFAISRQHPEGWDFNLSLHRGLMMLKKDGVVEQAFRDCGFLNPLTEDWRDVTYAG